MTRGRKRKPTRIKEIQGTLEKSRIIPNEMKPNSLIKLPDYPELIKNDPEALKLWNVYTQTLYNCGILTECDLTSLIMLCKYQSAWFDLTKFLDENGRVDENGKRRAEDIIARDLLVQILKLTVEFGFTPSSRTKIPMNKKKEEDEIFDN